MSVSRREFLTAASAAAITIGTPAISSATPVPLAAQKGPPVIGPIGAPGPIGATGRVLIGTTIESGMFKNLALSLVSVKSDPGYAFPALLDENGYPKSNPTSNIYGLVYMPSNITSADQLVLKWKGTAAIQLSRGAPGFIVTSGASFVSGDTSFSLTAKGTNVRVVFSFASKVPVNVTFSFLAGGPFVQLSNVVLCKLSDEAAIDNATTPEQMFDDNYVAAYQTLNVSAVRPMGWTNPNSGNVSQARYLPNWRTSINISSYRWPPGAWAGTTTGTNDYTCAAQPDASRTYVNGEMIQLQFTNSNTSKNLTLNSGGRGAVPIIVGFGGSTGLVPSVGAIVAGSLATLTYDAILGVFLWQPGGQTACIPYELQIAFANRISANYWCNFSASLDDTSISTIAALVRTGLKPGLSAYFEFGNEIWNNGFPATDFARLRGTALGFTADNDRQIHGWYGLRVRQSMGLVTAAWSPRSVTQLKRVMAFQAFGSSAGIAKYRIQGADLTGTSFPNYAAKGYPNYNSAPNRPIDFCDVLSYATYYSGAQCTNFDASYISRGAPAIAGLLAAADDYASGVPAKMASALAFIENDVRAGTLSGSNTSTSQTLLGLNAGYNGVGIYPTWEVVASAYGKPVECYEGGYEGWYPSTQACTTLGISITYGGPTGKIAALIEAFKMTDNFAAVVRTQISQFKAQKHSLTPAWLLVPGSNQWALSTGDTFASKYKSWSALVTVNH